jgi:hypothetical protein
LGALAGDITATWEAGLTVKGRRPGTGSPLAPAIAFLAKAGNPKGIEGRDHSAAWASQGGPSIPLPAPPNLSCYNGPTLAKALDGPRIAPGVRRFRASPSPGGAIATRGFPA